MTTFPLTIELTYVGSRLLRPPRAELQFTARFHNPGSEELWIVLPDDLTDRAPTGSKISSLERYELNPASIQVLHGLGTGGFFTLAIPGGGERRLRDLPLAFWGHVPDRVSLDLTCASHFTVNEHPVEEEMMIEFSSGGSAPADASPLANQRGVLQAIEAPFGATLDIAFSNTAILSLTVALS